MPKASVLDRAPVVSANFVDIEPGRCNPPIDGYAMTVQDGVNLVSNLKKVERFYAEEAIKCEATRDILTIENSALREERLTSNQWAILGKVSVGVGAVLLGLVTFFLVKEVVNGR